MYDYAGECMNQKEGTKIKLVSLSGSSDEVNRNLAGKRFSTPLKQNVGPSNSGCTFSWGKRADDVVRN